MTQRNPGSGNGKDHAEDPRPEGNGPDRPSDGDVEGIERSAKCAGVGAHIAYVQSQLDALGVRSGAEAKIKEKATRHLDAARKQVERRRWFEHPWHRLTKADVAAAFTNISEAEVELTKLLGEEELKSRVPQILTHAREHLSPGDPLRELLEEEWGRIVKELRHTPAEAKGAAVEALHEANKSQEQRRLRLRSFAAILICAIVVMTAIAVGFGAWAAVDHQVANLFCFPDSGRRTCPIGRTPNGSDVFLIEFMGMFAAALAGAVSLREMRGNSSPYHVSILLLLLRLPVGAMTAVLGILLVSGAFFTGLTRFAHSAQIIAWAAAFGILQEAVTRAVDKTGRSFLEDLTPYEEAKTPHGSARHHRERKADAQQQKRP